MATNARRSLDEPVLAALCDAYLGKLLPYVNAGPESAGLYCWIGEEKIPFKDQFDPLVAALKTAGGTTEYVYGQQMFRFTVHEDGGLSIGVVETH